MAVIENMKDILCLFFNNYDVSIAILHFILAIILFFIVNWIGKQSISVGYMQMDIIVKEDSAPAFNFVFKVLAPVVFMVLFTVLLQEIGLNKFNIYSFLIVVYYWIIRILWVLLTSKGSLTNWKTQLLYWISSISVSLWVYSLTEEVDRILPSTRSLLDQLWILIIIFSYSILNKLKPARQSTINRKNNYIEKRFSNFKQKYDRLIKGYFDNEFYEVITYSIMIYEDFNRPKAIRIIEYMRFFLTRKPHSLGVMQVITDSYINDISSITLAMQKIVKDNNDIVSSNEQGFYDNDASWLSYKIASKYNPGDSNYGSEIREIFIYLTEKYYNNIPTSFSKI